MNRNEVLLLGRWVQAACPQQKWDKHTPDVWTELLADYRAEDAMAAVKSLAAKQPFMAVSDIISEVKRIRQANFDALGQKQLDAISGASAPDPDDVEGFLEAVRSERKAIGDGVPVEDVPDVAAIDRSKAKDALIATLAERKSIAGRPGLGVSP